MSDHRDHRHLQRDQPFGVLNQADHIAAGRAVIDAICDVGNRWGFPELLDEGLEP